MEQKPNENIPNQTPAEMPSVPDSSAPKTEESWEMPAEFQMEMPRIPEKYMTSPRARMLFDWLEMFVIALSVLLVSITFFVRYTPVDGESMQNTLQDRDVMLLTNLFYTPKTGDIVVVQSPSYGLGKPLVKRVIATGGQTLKINFKTWEVWVDGQLLPEPYVLRDRGTTMVQCNWLPIEDDTVTYTIPEGKLFVMGDHRNDSMDSRFSRVGLIDERYVVGKVFFRIFPFRSIGKP